MYLDLQFRSSILLYLLDYALDRQAGLLFAAVLHDTYMVSTSQIFYFRLCCEVAKLPFLEKLVSELSYDVVVPGNCTADFIVPL